MGVTARRAVTLRALVPGVVALLLASAAPGGPAAVAEDSAGGATTSVAAHAAGAVVRAGRPWRPSSRRPLSLHWVLDEPLDLRDPRQMGLRAPDGRRLPAPDVYDIDLELNPASTVRALHARGAKVICYIDVGAYETYRRDAPRFRELSPQIWGRPDIGWEGSYWLDVRRVEELAPIMKDRMRACRDKGFDAVEPDEMTGWSNATGFPLTYDDQLVYNRAVAGWAREVGIGVGMKGDIEQAHELAPYFDWFLVEECVQYDECLRVSGSGTGEGARPGVQSFTRSGKAVWVAEYRPAPRATWRQVCRWGRRHHLNVARYRLGLPARGARLPCPGPRRHW